MNITITDIPVPAHLADLFQQLVDAIDSYKKDTREIVEGGWLDQDGIFHKD